MTSNQTGFGSNEVSVDGLGTYNNAKEGEEKAEREHLGQVRLVTL
jgi:hypothetical protein